MNYLNASPSSRPSLRLLRLATSLGLFLVSAFWAHAQGAGSITGSVTSADTQKALQGATVTIPSLNRSVLTDEAGRFLVSGLPAGQVDVVVSYTGFSDARQPVTVGTGGPAQLDVQMKSSDVVTMQAFTVATVREGQALAITEQRNAPNVKNVTAFDEWGVLPTQNVGELVSRLPGITFTTDEDNLINNVSIGGMPASYTRLNIDGMSSTGVGGDGRSATLHSFSASQYEAVEIIAGQTPERRADSLGGQLNLKTASPLAMADKRRTSYTVSGRYFHNPTNYALSERTFKPDVSITHQEVFDAFGGRRNLGILVSGSYQEVANPHDWDILLYEGTANPVAQLRDYQRQSGLNDRFIKAFSARADYKWSASTRVSLRFLYNGGSEPFFHYTAVNPFAGTGTNFTVNSPTNPTGSIREGYTGKTIEFLPATTTVAGTTVGATQMRLNPQRYSFISKNPTGTLAFEHNWGKLKVDHAWRWSNTHWNSGAGRNREAGSLQIRTQAPIGFALDYTDPAGAVFRQTSGPSVYDVNSYRTFVLANATATQTIPQTSTVLTKRDTVTDTNEVSGQINASYLLPTEMPITIKTGLDTVNRRVNNRQVYPRRWYGVAGTVPSVPGLMPLTEFERQHGGQRLPIIDPSAASTQLSNTALWTEDVNFTATSQYTNRRILEEGVDAAYIQAHAKIGRFSILGGVRGEWVTTDTFTFYRRNTTPIASEPDHFRRAALDFLPASTSGEYDKMFPSVHVSYDITPKLKARASWSTSYGRPGLANLIAGVTANDTARTVTIGNPALKPQTAKNIDLKLEYYHGTGNVSARVYKKKITDYIAGVGRSEERIASGPDNGFGGLYEDYVIFQASNAGDAEVKGLEIDVRQPLTFLPGALRGLTFRGNLTHLRSEGNFGLTTRYATGGIANFVPRAWNVGLQYVYSKWGVNFDVNHTGRWPLLNTLPGSTGARFREDWTVMNAGVSYRLFPTQTLFLSVANIAEEGRSEYIYIPDRVRSNWVIPRSFKFGITGRF